MNESCLDDIFYQQFVRLVASYTGLSLKGRARQNVEKTLRDRVRFLGLPSSKAYYQFLVREILAGSRDSQEWRALACQLTTIESYFFRDEGQFALLRDVLLPERIACNRARANASGCKPSLRLWSAGCSTGEEVYSLAICVRELLPDFDRWDVTIVGSDINERTLAKARQGGYSSWSFRSDLAGDRSKYFHYRDRTWQIDESLRRAVTFCYGNLVADLFPKPPLAWMDVILCRNVFIYFEPSAIAAVARKFYQTLQPGGYLLSAHAELHGNHPNDFLVKTFPKSIAYQRPSIVPIGEFCSLPRLSNSPSSSIPLPSSPIPAAYFQTSVAKSAPEIVPATYHAKLSDANACLQRGEYHAAIALGEQALSLHGAPLDACIAIAIACANSGRYDRGWEYCQKALEIDETAAQPYYLMARIAEERGCMEEAKVLLRKILYLYPNDAPAYLELGSIYQAEGNKPRAQKMFAIATEILRQLSPDTPCSFDGTTAEQLLAEIEKMPVVS